jgi:hypothetical protein
MTLPTNCNAVLAPFIRGSASMAYPDDVAELSDGARRISNSFENGTWRIQKSLA